MLKKRAEQNAGEVAVWEFFHPNDGRGMYGAAAAGTHMLVSGAEELFRNLDAEGDEWLWHPPSPAATDIQNGARREHSPEPSSNPRGIHACPPSGHPI